MARDVLGTIGNTPLVPLRRLAPPGGARVVLKVESTNPTGSMKDRMAQAAIEAAERDGRLRPGGTVVEYTGGSTGVALALVCAARGYRCRLVSSDAFSREKLDHMAAFGAEVTVLPSDQGRMTEALFKAMIARAAEYAREPGAFWTDQLRNRDIHRGYHALGEELRAQAGRVDVFVHSVGTAHSLAGVGEVLRRGGGPVRVVAVEPAESPILSQGRSGGHRIEGIGVGFVPPLWDASLADEVVAVSSDDAYAMARRLAREEGLFAGASTGANVHAALAVARTLPPEATVATLLVDTGLKYLTTELYGRGAG
ncbi:MAG: PLP-dependent cysteine synthase family protein [Deltaproteobacteria bacterium]|nr:PLP-dependent cysteine synthase family protein [Deltaproteobacteria bacterium]